MEIIIKHYGPAILALVTLLLLAAVLYGLYSTGFITTQFENLLTQAFTNMNSYIPTPSVTP